MDDATAEAIAPPLEARAALGNLESMVPATRKRIDEAVLETFSQREFHKVGLIEVARAANVSLQTIYKYYGSKEVLLYCSLDNQLRRLSDRLMEHLQGISDHKERLRKAFWASLDYFERNPRVLQLMMSSVHINSWRKPGNNEELRELLATITSVLAQGRQAGVLNDEVDERQLLDFIAGVILRTMQSWVMRGKIGSPSQRSDVLFEMVWRGIAKPQ